MQSNQPSNVRSDYPRCIKCCKAAAEKYQINADGIPPCKTQWGRKMVVILDTAWSTRCLAGGTDPKEGKMASKRTWVNIAGMAWDSHRQLAALAAFMGIAVGLCFGQVMWHEAIQEWRRK